jgi:aminoglycoside phosphotransferase (APT) family kinase protein
VHGDFRLGNLIIGPEGVRSVLDWELGHVGDPMEDLAWLCVRSWRFGNDQLPVAGVGQREDLFAAYEAAGGRDVDPAVVHWWELFGNLRWGVICIMQARAYLDGLSQSVELATIGRRTAETEWELLNLMGKTAGNG